MVTNSRWGVQAHAIHASITVVTAAACAPQLPVRDVRPRRTPTPPQPGLSTLLFAHTSLPFAPAPHHASQAPLRVQGWDDALLETARLGREVSSAELERHLAVLAAAARPVLVVTAVHDSIVLPDKVERMWKCGVPHARLVLLPECGHASHEEVPGLLLQQLAPFCASALAQAHAQGQHQGGWQPQGRQQAHKSEICAA